MKYLLPLLGILVVHPSTGFEGGRVVLNQPYTSEELPMEGKMLRPAKDGGLFFYVPRVHETFVSKDGGTGLSLESSKRTKNFSSSGLFYSRDGKKWLLGGADLHFVDVWTHPKTGMYFATIFGFGYYDDKGRTFRKVSCHIVTSKNAIDWRLIQGDLDPFRGFPKFFVDPTNDTKVCLYFPAIDITFKHWHVAQATDDTYSNWQIYTSREWDYDDPTK